MLVIFHRTAGPWAFCLPHEVQHTNNSFFWIYFFGILFPPSSISAHLNSLAFPFAFFHSELDLKSSHVLDEDGD